MSDHLQTRRTADGRDVSSLRAYQLFFALHCAGLLALKLVPEGEHGLGSILKLLAVKGGDVAVGWSLVTHIFLHVHPLEFAVAAGLLLFAGSQVERSLGAVRFSALYLGTGAVTGFLWELLSVGSGNTAFFLGGIASGAAALVAYVALEPRRRAFNVLPAPGVFVAVAAFVILPTIYYLELEPSRVLDEYLRMPLTTTFTAETWMDRQWEYTTREAIAAPHLLGFAVGAAIFGVEAIGIYVFSRLHVRREIRRLEEELDARERVDALLEKISKDGVDSLSRRERKFLKYASARFYFDKKRVLSE
jgi:membrane associated rhomboid family serine protease